jgi:hypothetical protein
VPERCGIQIQEDANKTIAHQFEKTPGNGRKPAERGVQLIWRNRANARRLDCLRKTVVHELADAGHFPKNRRGLEFGDDELLPSGGPEGLHAAFFKEEQDLAAFSRPEESMAGPKVQNLTIVFERPQARGGEIF